MWWPGTQWIWISAVSLSLSLSFRMQPEKLYGNFNCLLLYTNTWVPAVRVSCMKIRNKKQNKCEKTRAIMLTWFDYLRIPETVGSWLREREREREEESCGTRTHQVHHATLDTFVLKSVIIFISRARARRSWNITTSLLLSFSFSIQIKFGCCSICIGNVA